MTTEEKREVTPVERRAMALFCSEILFHIRHGKATKQWLISKVQDLFRDCPSDKDAFDFVCAILLDIHNPILVMALGLRTLGKLNLKPETVEQFMTMGILERVGSSISLSESVELALDTLEEAAKAKGLSLSDLLNYAMKNGLGKGETK